MKHGALLGKGMTSEVYEWENDRIIKLFFEWVPMEWVQYESQLCTKLCEIGVPSPACYGIYEEKERRGIVYERIHGESLSSMIMHKPYLLKRHAKTLAELQFAIHRLECTEVKTQKDQMTEGIMQSSDILGNRITAILNSLKKLSASEHICHGDLHPDNILVANGKAIDIDWMNTSRGNPMGDVQRTCLMIQSPYISSDRPPILKFVVKGIKRLLHYWYQKHYLKLSGATKVELRSWLVPVAAARIRENIPDEKEWLIGLIDKSLKEK